MSPGGYGRTGDGLGEHKPGPIRTATAGPGMLAETTERLRYRGRYHS